MFKKQLGTLLVALLLTGLFQTYAIAAVQAELADFSVEFNRMTKQVLIKGKHTGGVGRFVAVKVFEEHTPFISLYEDDAKITESGGAFQFNFIMDGNADPSGKYLVVAKGTNTSQVQVGYKFVNDSDPGIGEYLLEDLNGVNTANKGQLKEKLNYLAKKGYIDIDSAYDRLEDVKLNSANNMILEKQPFVSFQEVSRVVNDVLADLNRPSDENSSKGSSRGSGGKSASMALTGTVPPVPDNQPVFDFTDISHVFWAAESIHYLAGKGFINGTSNNTFEPDRNIKREEFVKILVNAFGLLNPDAETEFRDVDKSQWYYRYIASAKSKGIINGLDEYRFGIGEGMTREEMCTMVYRAVEIMGMELPATREEKIFEDDGKIEGYAKEGVYKLFGAEIINGIDEGSFAPKTSCTRAMTAKVVYTILKNTGRAGQEGSYEK